MDDWDEGGVDGGVLGGSELLSDGLSPFDEDEDGGGDSDDDEAELFSSSELSSRASSLDSCLSTSVLAGASDS